MELRTYWDPLAIEPDLTIQDDEAEQRLRELLYDAVGSHLESEVPLGAFLSGGLDSSTVVALMCRGAGSKVRTFSVGFDEPGFDESGQAAAVARELGTEHVAVTMSPNAEVLLDKVVGIYDEPFADSSAMPTYLVSALAREHVTVALSGDGGDELFGGYPWYPALAGRSAGEALPPSMTRWVGSHWPWVLPGRGRALDFVGERRARFNARHAAPVLASEGGVAAADLPGVPRQEEWFRDVWERLGQREFVCQMSLVDMSYYLPNILTKVDRASMAVSLEARVPLLHLPLVEFALSLPGAMKVRGGVTKRIFRRVIRGLVPDVVLRHPKRGFTVPLGAWLRGPLQPSLRDLDGLADDFPGVFDMARIARLGREHVAGRRDHSAMLWRLLVLRRWSRHLRAGDLARPVPRVDSGALLGRVTLCAAGA
jgi:asparagine synthase (glutamine-hydrolysing)